MLCGFAMSKPFAPFNSLRQASHLLFSSVSSWRLAGLVTGMILVALTEGVSFLMLVPMLDTIVGLPAAAAELRISIGPTAFKIPLGWLMLGFVALVAVRSACQHFRVLAGTRIENEAVDALRLRCFSALMGAEWRLVSRQRLSDYSSLIITNIDRIGFGINQVVTIAALAITAAAFIGAACLLSPRLTFFAMLCGALVMLVFGKQRRRAASLGKEQNATYEEVFAQIQEGLAGIRITKIFRQEPQQIAQLGRVFKALRHNQLSFLRSASLGTSALNIGGAALLALTIYLGLTVWQVPIQKLLPLVLLFARLIPVLSGLQQCWENLLHATPALHDVATMLDEIALNSEPEASADLADLPLIQTITLDNVTVTYAGRNRPALDRVSLTIPARTTTVVMGPSGAGKSTLADVLMGLIVPDGGTIKVDGVPLIGIARMRWRGSVAYVQQDPFLFHTTIRANLLWASPHALPAEIDQALRAASADFINDLPHGLDTIVGDGGIRLSGGERQRIVLARALLRKPALLILDEATSALDPENELTIRSAIEQLHGAMTVIVIGHRVAMVNAADQVIKVQHGRVAVSGNSVPRKQKSEPAVTL